MPNIVQQRDSMLGVPGYPTWSTSRSEGDGTSMSKQGLAKQGACSSGIRLTPNMPQIHATVMEVTYVTSGFVQMRGDTPSCGNSKREKWRFQHDPTIEPSNLGLSHRLNWGWSTWSWAAYWPSLPEMHPSPEKAPEHPKPRYSTGARGDVYWLFDVPGSWQWKTRVLWTTSPMLSMSVACTWHACRLEIPSLRVPSPQMVLVDVGCMPMFVSCDISFVGYNKQMVYDGVCSFSLWKLPKLQS